MRLMFLTILPLLFIGFPIEAYSNCYDVEADHTYTVNSAGKHANSPEDLNEVQEGCSGYIADFISPNRKMLSFKPDIDWIKQIPIGHFCQAECSDVNGAHNLDKYRATITLYKCAHLRDCLSHSFSPEKVSSYKVVYKDSLTLIGTGENVCDATTQDLIPVIENVHGVRFVVKPIRQIFRSGCDVQQVPLQSDFRINTSGTVGMLTVGPLKDGKRPRAEALKE